MKTAVTNALLKAKRSNFRTFVLYNCIKNEKLILLKTPNLDMHLKCRISDYYDVSFYVEFAAFKKAANFLRHSSQIKHVIKLFQKNRYLQSELYVLNFSTIFNKFINIE